MQATRGSWRQLVLRSTECTDPRNILLIAPVRWWSLGKFAGWGPCVAYFGIAETVRRAGSLAAEPFAESAASGGR